MIYILSKNGKKTERGKIKKFKISTNKEFNMVSEMENVNEELIEELTATKGRKKAASDGKHRGRARR